MWQHFWHLMWRSLVYMPSTISGNWLSIFFPLAIFLVRECFRIKKEGWRTVSWGGVRADTAYMVGGYFLLFVLAVVQTVYGDHQYLVGINSGLRTKITQLEEDST